MMSDLDLALLVFCFLFGMMIFGLFMYWYTGLKYYEDKAKEKERIMKENYEHMKRMENL